MEPNVIRIVVLLAIFASAFVFSQVLLETVWRHRQAFAAINKRLRLIKEGENREQIIARLRKNAPTQFPASISFLERPTFYFQRLLFAAALPFGPKMLLWMLGIAFAIVTGALFLVSGLAGFGMTTGVVMLVLALALCIAVVIPWSIISLRAQTRRNRVGEQFPVALDIFVRALRSGHPIASAIDLLTHEMEDPIGSEFGLVADEVSYGADMVDALQAMAQRWDSGDMRMFVVSLAVQSETGGNLAEILENLANVIRARSAMYMKVRALSAEGRLTGWMLSILPILSFIGMFLINPAFYLEIAADPIFVFGFGGLIALYFVGLYAIRRMIDLKV